MKKLLALMVAMIMVLGLASFAVALEIHHPAKKDLDGQVSKKGKSIGIIYVNDWFSEGDTSDAFGTTIGVVDPTGNNAIDFPDASGIVALTGDISSSMELSDTKILVGQSTGLAAEKTLSLTGDVTASLITNSGAIATTISAGVVLESMVQVPTAEALGLKRTARTVFDYTDQPAAGTFNTNITLPDNAIVTRSWFDVTTAFSDDTAGAQTIAIGINTNDTDGIKAAGNIAAWGSGYIEGIQLGTTATMSEKTTAARTVDVVVAGSTPLDDGSMVIFIEYVVSQ